MIVFHEKCSKCGANTAHRSGMCKNCRVVKCKGCGKSLLPKMTVYTYCCVCNKKRQGDERKSYLSDHYIV